MGSDSDPLLPRTNPSPEVHGSQARRFNDIGEINQDSDDIRVDDFARRGTSSGGMGSSGSRVLGFVGIALFLFFLLGLLPDGFLSNWIPGREHKPRSIEDRVSAILKDTPLIDGHNDLAITIRALFNNHINNETFQDQFEYGGMLGHVDLPRLEAGQNGGAFWSAFVPCPAKGDDFSDENYAKSVQFTYTQIDLLNRLFVLFPSKFAPYLNSSTVKHPRANKGKLISPLGIEGLHQIGNTVSNLRNMHSLGVRYATLTHNCHNIYADAALTELSQGMQGGIEVAKPKWNGVSPAGRTLIKEMNRIGMIVDLAHTSHATQIDVLGGNETWGGSSAPPIFSHSSAYALCPHPRNVQDDVLQLVKKTKSIVMVNFSPDFISCAADPSNVHGLPKFDPKNSTLEHVVDHIMYIGELIGYDYVGLGSDFDGIPSTPEGLEDVSNFPDLIAGLLKRGVSDEDAGKIAGGNILRVWKAVDEVAERMQKNGELPLEDELEDLFE